MPKRSSGVKRLETEATLARRARIKTARAKLEKKSALTTLGSSKAPVLVVCDTPAVKTYVGGEVMAHAEMKFFGKQMTEHGFSKNDFQFVLSAPPIPDSAEGSAKREGMFLDTFRPELFDVVERSKAKLIVAFGAQSCRQLFGKNVAITKARGQIMDIGERFPPVLPMLSPKTIMRQPRNRGQLVADLGIIATLRDHGFDPLAEELNLQKSCYVYVTGETLYNRIAEVAAEGGEVPFAWDTETIGGKWYEGAVPILIQCTVAEGECLMVPVHETFITNASEAAENRRWVQKCFDDFPLVFAGHNLKYDLHVMENAGFKIDLGSWGHDTMQLSFNIDENLMSHDLANVTRIYCPPLAGYSDHFDKTVDKSRMNEVDPEFMRSYAGGDADAVFRMSFDMLDRLDSDARQAATYDRIQMPALRMFYDVERRGIRINKKNLREFEVSIAAEENRIYNELMEQVPGSIKRKFHDPKNKNREGLSFRAALEVDLLFQHEDGFQFEPRVFTPGTRKLPAEERIPSSSKKDHYPYFEEEPFVAQLIQYKTIQKLQSTYIGKEYDEKKKQPTGLWQYIRNGYIRPSYMLHRTVTGRTASADPNGQNFPKRGELAKAYRKNFVPRKGFVFMESDLSQAELRVAACMAGERNMIELYQKGADIHAATAAATMGLSLEDFYKLPKKEVAAQRQKAKAINFGFLYGMGWRKFRAYAKTDYGVEFTEEEAELTRIKFFQAYPGLEGWHKAMRRFARENGYVRALHGARRNLPDIFSNDEGIRSMAERQAINSPVQRFASDVGLIGGIRFHRDCPKEKAAIVAFIHDAVILEVRKGCEDEIASAVKFYLESPPLKEWFGLDLPVPIVADVSVGTNLGTMDELDGVKSVAPEWYRPDLDAA